MADKRAFAKFDVGYLDNPKMLDVLDASSSAILMHFASVLYCAQHLTDGVVASKAMQRKAGGTDDDVQLLLSSGLWHEPGHDCDGCPEPPIGKVYVHDFLEHNRDSAQAKRVSEKRSEAATSMWEKKKAEQSAMQIALQPALQNEPVCNAEREREKERLNTPPSPAKPSREFDDWYAHYPKKEAKEAARKAFAKARKQADLKDLIEGADKYAATMRDKDRQFIALPATWLNAGRWADEITETPSQPGWTLGLDL